MGRQERENLYAQVIEALEQFTAYYEGRGDLQAANSWLARLLELDPLREKAHRQYMSVLALNGQRSAALNHYKAYQRYLARELDIAPEAETTDLYEKIRSGELGPGKANGGISLSTRAKAESNKPDRKSVV